MLKPFAFILTIFLVFALSVIVPPTIDEWRAQEIRDSVTTDSLNLVARIYQLERDLIPYDDTLQMADSKTTLVDSVYYVSYRHMNTDPHPEIRQRGPLPFFVDSIYKTDSTLTFELYGVKSGGYPPWGSACLRNDTLILFYWEENTGQPPLGAYFKWSLYFTMNADQFEPPNVIKLVDRNEIYRRREALFIQYGFRQLQNVLEYFHSAIVRARIYRPDIACSSVGCGVQDSYRPFPDTASLITKKDARLLSFSYSFPQFTEEEMRTKTYRMHTGYTILRKDEEADLLTITMAGNQGSRYTMDGNILIEGDTIFFIQWPSEPEEQKALAIFKRELTYTIRVPRRQWYFRNINLTSYVWDNEKWYRQQFPVQE